MSSPIKQEIPTKEIVDRWLDVVPWKTPREAAEYWLKVMREKKPSLQLGFMDTFVQRMYKLCASYHPVMLYRLIHYYPEWIRQEKFGQTFIKDFPSPGDFCNNIQQMSNDLYRDSSAYHTGRSLAFGRPVADGSWEDKVYGMDTGRDGGKSEADKFGWPKELKDVLYRHRMDGVTPPLSPSAPEGKELSTEEALDGEEGDAVEEP